MDLLKYLIVPQGRESDLAGTADACPMAQSGSPRQRELTSGQKSEMTRDVTVTRLLSDTVQPITLVDVQQGTTAPQICQADVLPSSGLDCSNAAVDDVHHSTIDNGGVATNATRKGKYISLICSFWYHHGECRRDPESKSYDGSGKVCRYLHYIGPRMDKVEVQSIPWQWHRMPCGLDHCPQKMGMRGWPSPRQRLADRRMNRGNCRRSKIEPRTCQASRINVQDESAALVETLDTAGQRGGSRTGRKTRNRRRKREVGNGKRDGEQGETPPVTVTMPATKEKSEIGVAEAVVNETCFFWYHGCCRRSKNCRLLHALTNPPSFVQPPPDYTHRAMCGLEWCPGDRGHAPKHLRGSNHQNGNRDMDRVGHGSGVEHAEQVELDCRVDDFAKEDWYLDGFPCA